MLINSGAFLFELLLAGDRIIQFALDGCLDMLVHATFGGCALQCMMHHIMARTTAAPASCLRAPWRKVSHASPRPSGRRTLL